MNPQFVLAYVGLALSELGRGRRSRRSTRGTARRDRSRRGFRGGGGSRGPAPSTRDGSDDARKILEPAIDADLAAKNTDDAARKLTALAEAHLALGHTRARDRGGRPGDGDERDLAVVVSGAPRSHRAPATTRRRSPPPHSSRARLEPDPQMYGSLLQGEAEIERRDYRAAIARLKEARKLADSWLVRFALGRACIRGRVVRGGGRGVRTRA
jgi:hypothetical protein